MRFTGKVALITGAAVGIGYATAIKFATEGADVVLFDMNEEKLQKLQQKLAADNVLVNSVSPGSVSPSEQDDCDFFQESELSFMGRTGTTMENAGLICFLASEEAGYISGQNIQIDGCRKKQ